MQRSESRGAPSLPPRRLCEPCDLCEPCHQGVLRLREAAWRLAHLSLLFGHTILPRASAQCRPPAPPTTRAPCPVLADGILDALRSALRRKDMAAPAIPASTMPRRRRRGSRTPLGRRPPSCTGPTWPSSSGAGFGAGQRPPPCRKVLRRSLALVPMGTIAPADDFAAHESVHRLLHLAAVLALYHAGLEALQEHAVDAAELEVVPAGL